MKVLIVLAFSALFIVIYIFIDRIADRKPERGVTSSKKKKQTNLYPKRRKKPSNYKSF